MHAQRDPQPERSSESIHLPDLSKQFSNLAGKSEEEAVRHILSELNTIDVPMVRLQNSIPHPDVRANCIGVLEFENGPRVEFTREWRYWSVRASTPLPQDAAIQLNQACGDHVHMDGHGSGKRYSTPLIADGHLPSRWHVDTLRGLIAVTESYRTLYGAHVTTPSISNQLDHRIAHNDQACPRSS
jgi:hypothetical protein